MSVVAGDTVAVKVTAVLTLGPVDEAVSVGEGIEGAGRRGSEHHDPILHDPESGFHRPSNRAGGVEGVPQRREDGRQYYLMPRRTRRDLHRRLAAGARA